MERKKKFRKVSKKKVGSYDKVVEDKTVSHNYEYSKTSYWKIFFVVIILLIFFSSSFLVFFANNDRQEIIFNESKKSILQKLRNEGPSVEVYKSFAELYKSRDPNLHYYYLKEAIKLVKSGELDKNRDLIKQILEASYQKNEKIETILYYLILLYKTTKPSNPEFFEVLASIVEIYNTLGNVDSSQKILSNLEKLYSQNLQIKYLLCNQYYVTGNYGLAKEKIDYIINIKMKQKQPLNFNDLSLYYLIYMRFYPYDRVLENMLPFSLGLAYNEMNNFLVFLLDRPEINFKDYKRILSKISIYRPEVKIITEQNPYINLEIGKRFWKESQKAIAEVYFGKALNNSSNETRKIIQDYIYQIKVQDDINQQKSKPTIDTKKLLEEVK
ncbi:MAG: hypothetical protein RMJ36_02760 [Candidatus Calescibacterium sp.]|nr:hypothetical protein [Candidatus Calescibacterium sp.]MDW8132561.1 hypothetical protein [Candidatus Calescibacterium sp.]